MFERAVLVHYHEIGLKGRNRGRFERQLQDNLATAVGTLASAGVQRVASRLVIPVPASLADATLARVAAVPGVSSASIAFVTSRDPREMEQAAVLAVREAAPGARTFAIAARRSATDHAERSLDMNRRIGAAVQAETGLRVNLDAPDVLCRVEVVQGEVYTFAQRAEGPGGLPVGTSGKVVSLLSAGIDSPVATWRMIRRGAVAVGVHFSGRPQTDDLSERIAGEIATVLERTGGFARLYVVPFGDLQREMSLAAPPDLRILLYRRLMVRVSEAIAEQERAGALVTGESLGQVASQTLENIAVVDAAATLPVLRPLVGNDKQEIITEARRIGTYELSIQPHADCCTLFMPRTPETHATLTQVQRGEEGLDVSRMVDDALASLSWTDYACVAYHAPKRWPSNFTR
ncbi:MAG: tRNA 4-thiouridine(8) synthase ThiI [Actinomycetia bacterium]|nr:tRNA 4-thiouridine(8) synthase ThiI [Actinomycetes bacterium]